MKPKTYELMGETHRAVYGDARSKKLAVLAEEANTNHRQAEEAWRGLLEHARQAGMALLHARKICGGRSKWSRWRAANFEGSKEKCNQYIRVARHWHDPRIIEARTISTIASVEGFLNVIRNSRKKPDATAILDRQSQEDMDADWQRVAIRKAHVDFIGSLSPLELEVYCQDCSKLYREMILPYIRAEVRREKKNVPTVESYISRGSRQMQKRQARLARAGLQN